MDTSNALRVGVQLWPQHTTWQEMTEAAQELDHMGYDSVWTWDHFYPHVGERDGPNFEAWTLIAALAAVTASIRLGVLVSSVSYRNPALLAYQAATLDHISKGRAALGLGAGWFYEEHQSLGFPWGTVRERLDRLQEAAAIIRDLLDGALVTREGQHYNVHQGTLKLQPVQKCLPLYIGGGGERITLRIVARYADVWNYYGSPEELRRKSAVLDEHCEAVGRTREEISRSAAVQVIVRDDDKAVNRRQQAVFERNHATRAQFIGETGLAIAGTPDTVAEQLQPYIDAGFRELIMMGPAPYDHETFKRFIKEVLPLLKSNIT